MQQIILLKGLPASGKSTWAKQKVKEDLNFLIVSRDSLREMVCGDYDLFPFGSSKYEEMLTQITINATVQILLSGFSVILDETNLNTKRRNSFLRKIEKGVNNIISYEVIIKEFLEVSIEECIQRDKNRDRSVGHHIIKGMAKKYNIK